LRTPLTAIDASVLISHFCFRALVFAGHFPNYFLGALNAPAGAVGTTLAPIRNSRTYA
jgi:hypothetical protein